MCSHEGIDHANWFAPQLTAVAGATIRLVALSWLARFLRETGGRLTAKKSPPIMCEDGKRDGIKSVACPVEPLIVVIVF